DGELRHREVKLISNGLELLDALKQVVLHETLNEARAALGICGARAGRRRLARLVLAREDTLGDGGPDDLPKSAFLRRRDDLVLDDAPQHRVLRLRGDELEAQVLGVASAFTDLIGGPLAHSDVQRFALANDVRES